VQLNVWKSLPFPTKYSGNCAAVWRRAGRSSGRGARKKFRSQEMRQKTVEKPENARMTIRIGIINVSDRASQGIYEDTPGITIAATLREYLRSTWEKEYAVIPDEQALIERTLIDMADNKGCCLIITSGG